MSAPNEWPRQKLIHALTRSLLEAEVRRWETEGWGRIGGIALAKPTAPEEPSYWTQSLAHPLASAGYQGLEIVRLDGTGRSVSGG